MNFSELNQILVSFDAESARALLYHIGAVEQTPDSPWRQDDLMNEPVMQEISKNIQELGREERELIDRKLWEIHNDAWDGEMRRDFSDPAFVGGMDSKIEEYLNSIPQEQDAHPTEKTRERT